MRFGCCGSTVNPGRDPIGIEVIEMLKSTGYDYIELSLRDMMKLSGPDFLKLRKRVRDSGLPCEACNNFLPVDLKVTGPHVDTEAVLGYVDGALERAREVGAEVIVFGSPASRDIDIDFCRERAQNQMMDILVKMGEIARKHDITIAMEHVNSFESNMLTSLLETYRLVRETGHAHIQLLLDYFHLALEKEPLHTMLEAGDWIKHVHFARVYKRMYPKDLREDPRYGEFFVNLKRIHYRHRISIEGYTCNFKEDASKTLALLKSSLSPGAGEP